MISFTFSLGQEFEGDLAGNFCLRVSPEFKCSQIPARLQPPESFIRAEGSTFRRRFCYKAGVLVLGIMKRLWFLFTQASVCGCLKSWHHVVFHRVKWTHTHTHTNTKNKKPKQKLQCHLWYSLGNHNFTMFSAPPVSVWKETRQNIVTRR